MQKFTEIFLDFTGVPVMQENRELFIIEDNTDEKIALASAFFEQFQ